MNATSSHSIDSLFGPASELIDVTGFLDSAGVTNIEQTVQEYKVTEELELECSVSDICDTLTKTWNDATLSAHHMKSHEHAVSMLHNSVPQASKSGRKTRLPLVETAPAEVESMQKCIDAVSLKCFRLDSDSVLFLRASKNSDFNALNSIRRASNMGSKDSSKGVITVSIYDRVSWGQSYVTRSSQHALLCDQTLQDICDTLPCLSKHLVAETSTPDQQTDCILLLEGKAYSSHARSKGYADKLARHLQSSSTNVIIEAPTTMKETKISSLSIRINEPYWLIHVGNCEHFVVFNQIRLLHSSDPHSSYPLTLHMSPSLLDLCQACNRVPAVWSVVGDLRLGESPCVLCAPCWEHMGKSSSDEVEVIPVPCID